MPRKLIPRLPHLATVLSVLLITGCESLGYYSQAIRGHLALNRGRQPIEQALVDERLSAIERERLALVPEIMDFAKSTLGLPSEDQYETLIFMNRNAVTWNVFAAPTDTLIPMNWCFPIVGCISYRGYFAQTEAKAYAEKLSTAGWDTYVGGAAAYSTLGWFDDPLLSTFLQRETPEFIGLLFHELAHQQLYIKNDTTFNESFATTIEQAGVIAWYELNPNPSELAGYLARYEQRTSFIALAMSTKTQLKALYESHRSQPIAELDLVTEKNKILDKFREQYAQNVSTIWQGEKPYGGWMQGPLNNAQWNTLGAYYDLVPAFTHLLQHLQHDFQAFYDVCEALGKMSKAERYQHLNACKQNTCPIATTHSTKNAS